MVKTSKTKEKKPGPIKRVGQEFKDFIARGNVIDLAVGIIIGGAFGAVTASLVNDIVTPFVGMIIGGFDFSSLAITVGHAHIKYGSFLQTILNFLIIAICIFALVKLINSIEKAAGVKKTEVEDTAVKKKESEQLVVLREIRDELKRNK